MASATRTERDLLVTPTRRRGPGWATPYVVRLIRGGLAVLILALVVTIFLWPSMRDQAVPVVATPDVTEASNELVNPMFESVDRDGQPFRITAVRAVQEPGNPDLINLTMPSGEITLKSSEKVTIRAAEGKYDQTARTLNLTGQVVVAMSAGHVLTTDRLSVDMRAGLLNSHGAVTVTSPLGSIKAADMTGNEAGKILIFGGPATLVIEKGIL
jgi:LPS export ABC transporter protein LptC